MTETSAPRHIRLLPEHLIDQIKAGEVIERPANVLKELLENALDAKADKIDIEIKDNGLSLLRVSDNGVGIRASELELAFGRHATSKIENFEDLYRLSTYGFRGEALPSIASISKLECVSWTAREPVGGSIRFEGGRAGGIHQVGKSGTQHGTTMTVQDLFFNTPARLKFMQSATSEKNWLKKFFYAVVLSHPHITFTLQWDDEERLIYPKCDTHQERLLQLFKRGARDKLTMVEATREWQGLRCHILSVQTAGARADGPIEHVTVNGRPVLDKAYGRVCQQVLDKHGFSEMPSLMINLQVPAQLVDVNVHPNKTLVKFHQISDVLSLVTATLRETLPTNRFETAPAAVLPMQEMPARSHDLERDRAESYGQHLFRMQEGHFVSEENADALRLLATQSGPYFLWQYPGSEYPLYIDGRKLLSIWVTTQPPADSTPLLVSHPLRIKNLSSDRMEKLKSWGFEIDELEPGFLVVREIPVWGRGLPIAVLCAVCCEIQIEDFDYAQISENKWIEIFKTYSPQDWCSKGAVRFISKQLFGGSKNE